MKKHIIHALSLSTLGLALTACGGNGGGFGATPAPQTTTSTPTNTNTTPTTNTNGAFQAVATTGAGTGTNTASPTTTPTNNNSTIGTGTPNPTGTTVVGVDTTKQPQTPTDINVSIQGVKIAVERTGISAMSPIVGTPEIDKVVIDGKVITLGRNLTTGTRFNNVRYGYLNQNGSTPTLVAQGVLSSNVPNRGQATYRGSAVHVTSNSTSPSIQTVPATFNVDFANKTLTGRVQASNGINLNATISGNRFSGVTADGFSTLGYFYGDNASELGGTYKNGDNTIGGAYGAKK